MLNSKSLVWLPIGGSAGLISAGAATVLISRSLGPDLRGELYSIFAIVFLGSVMTLGGDGLKLRRELSIEPEGQVIGRVFRALLLRSVPATALIILLALYLVGTEAYSLRIEVLLVNALSLTSFVVNLLLGMVHLGRSNYALASLNIVGIPLSHFCLSLVLYQNPESLPLSLSLANLLVPLLLVFITLPMKDLSSPGTRYLPSGNGREFFGGAIFPHLVGRIEIILCFLVSGASTSGYVSIGHGLAAGILPLSQLLTEGLFGRAARGEMVGSNRVLVRNMLVIFLAGFTLSVAAFFLIGPVLGDAFTTGRLLIVLATSSSTLGITAFISSQLLVATGAGKTGKRIALWLIFATCTSIALASIFEISAEVTLYVFMSTYLVITISNLRQLKELIN